MTRAARVATVMLSAGLTTAGVSTAGFRTAEGAELFTASLRVNPEWRTDNEQSAFAPLEQQFSSGADSVTTDVEMGITREFIAATATLRHLAMQDEGASTQLLLNELHVSTQQAGWYLTAGKQIVSWDVGQAFRPLDVIQRENRRRLVATRLEGVPLLLAERFGEHIATSLAIVNPLRTTNDDEAALGARLYWQAGPADWHVVARYGEDSGPSGGVALAYVATAALELHGSILWARHLEHLTQLATPGLTDLPDYQARSGAGGILALVGGSWTGASKVSVLLEWWRDERAWSPSRWERWQTELQRVRRVPMLLPVLAAQADALRVPSLHRDNGLLRLGYTAGSFTPSADVLYMPADGGAIGTVRLQWQGTRLGVEAGWRCNFGSAASVVRQLPTRSTAFVSADFNF